MFSIKEARVDLAKKVLIVGSGLSGATLARELAEAGEVVVVAEARNHLGGNVYDYQDSNGIMVHKYGPHAFHTNSLNVWEFVNKYSEWIPYEHRVRALVEGFFVPVPFNFTSIDLLLPEIAEDLKGSLTKIVDSKGEISVTKLSNERSNQNLIKLSEYVRKNIFEGYSFKQWGLRLDQLERGVLDRVPIRASYDDRYFLDKYQGLPTNGYSSFVENLLDHPRIQKMIDWTVTLEDICESSAKYVIYTGPLDSLFKWDLGTLEYRSLRFDIHSSVNSPNHFPAPQTNFPNNYEFTRITDYSKFYSYPSPACALAVEFPEAYIKGKNEPFYPFSDKTNRQLHDSYLERIKELPITVYPVGRLAEYRYFNMDQAISSALVTARQIMDAKDEQSGEN